MDSDEDIDLEELESRLYSQVHHSSIKENVPIASPQPSTSTTDHQTSSQLRRRMSGNNRYFAEKPNPIESTPSTSNINIRVNFDGFAKISQQANSIQFNFNQNESLPPTNVNQSNNSVQEIQTSDVMPQYVPLTYPPIANNVYIIPQGTPVRTESRGRLNKWKQRQQEREHVLKAASENAELFRLLSMDDRKKVQKYEKRQRRILMRKNKKKVAKELLLINQYNYNMQEQMKVTPNEGVVSDISIKKDSTNVNNNQNTSDNACPEKNENVLVFISSDDESDVMIIEQDESQKVEIISLESEPISKGLNDSQLMKPPSDPESKNKHPNDLTTKERNELSSTPESSTNDFLDPSDVLPKETNEFNASKPRPVSEIESESSCGASDISTPVKSNIFIEPEFETPKELFNESNLEQFGEFITPRRKTVSPTPEKKETARKSSKTKKVSTNEPDKDETDSSSSESDFENANSLPNLSYFGDNPDQDDDSSTPVKKRKGSFKNKEELKAKRKKKSKSFEEKLDDLVNKLIQSKDSLEKSKKKSPLVSEDKSDVPESTKKTKKKKSKAESDKWNVEEDTNSKLSKGFIIVDECGEDFNEKSPQTSEEDSFKPIESSDEDILSDMENIGKDMNLANIKLVEHPKPKQTKENVNKRFIDTWSEDMETWHNNNLNEICEDIKKVQKRMTDDPSKWKILDCDVFYIGQRTPRGPRCAKCNHPGHKAMNCMEKPGPSKCSLCGALGHLEPRCPNKICTGCGRKSPFTTIYCSKCASMQKETCSLCKMIGHSHEYCPDLWRRYHLTTEEGPIVELGTKKSKHASDLKPHQKRWCSGCAKKGHLEYKCKYYNRTHPPVAPFIIKYEEIYGFAQNRKKKFSENDDNIDTMKLPPENKNKVQGEINVEDAKIAAKGNDRDTIKKKTKLKHQEISNDEEKEVITSDSCDPKERVKRKRENLNKLNESIKENTPKKLKVNKNTTIENIEESVILKKKKKKTKNQEVSDNDKSEESPAKNKKSKADYMEVDTPSKSPKTKVKKKKSSKSVSDNDSCNDTLELEKSNALMITRSTKKKKQKPTIENNETLDNNIETSIKKSAKRKNKSSQFLENEENQEKSVESETVNDDNRKSSKQRKSQIDTENEVPIMSDTSLKSKRSKSKKEIRSNIEEATISDQQDSREVTNLSNIIPTEVDHHVNEGDQLTTSNDLHNSEFATLSVFTDQFLNEATADDEDDDDKEDSNFIISETLTDILIQSKDDNIETNQGNNATLKVNVDQNQSKENAIKSEIDSHNIVTNVLQLESTEKETSLNNVVVRPNIRNESQANVSMEVKTELSVNVKKEIISGKADSTNPVVEKTSSEGSQMDPLLESNTTEAQTVDKCNENNINSSKNMNTNSQISVINIKRETVVNITTVETAVRENIDTPIKTECNSGINTLSKDSSEGHNIPNQQLGDNATISKHNIELNSNENINSIINNEQTIEKNQNTSTIVTENQILNVQNEISLNVETPATQNNPNNEIQVTEGTIDQNVLNVSSKKTIDRSKIEKLLKELEVSMDNYKVYLSYNLKYRHTFVRRDGKTKELLTTLKVQYDDLSQCVYTEGKGPDVVRKIRTVLYFLKTPDVSIHFHSLIAYIQYHFRCIQMVSCHDYLKHYSKFYKAKVINRDKFRRKLNIILLAHCKLKEGPKHLQNLKNIFINNDKPKCYFSSFTVESVQASINYIFNSDLSFMFYKTAMDDIKCNRISFGKNVLRDIFQRKIEWNIRGFTNESTSPCITQSCTDIETVNQSIQSNSNVTPLFEYDPLVNYKVIMKYLRTTEKIHNIYISLSDDDFANFLSKKMKGYKKFLNVKDKVDETYSLLELNNHGKMLCKQISRLQSFLKKTHLFITLEGKLAKIIFYFRKVYLEYNELDLPVMLYADYFHTIRQPFQRMKLNMCLFAYYGLEDGRKHLNKLKELFKTYNNPGSTFPSSVGSEIEKSLNYIFFEERTYNTYLKLVEYIHDNNLKPLLILDDLFVQDVVPKNKIPTDSIEIIKYNISEAESKLVFESPIMEELLTEIRQNIFYEIKSLPECSGNYNVIIMKGLVKNITTAYMKFVKILNNRDAMDSYTKPTEIFKFLLESLTNLNILYYTTDCNKLYEEIISLEQSPNLQSAPKLQEDFKKLNAILFGKHELHDGKRHMATLIYFREKLKGAVEGDIMTPCSFLEIKNAHKFIFDSTRKANVDYLLALQVIDNGEKRDFIKDIDQNCKNNVQDQIEHYKNTFIESRHEGKLQEVQAFANYLTSTEFNGKVYDSALRFLRDIEKYLLEYKHL